MTGMSSPIAGRKPPARRPPTSPAPRRGLFQQLFNFFSESSEAERRKKQLLKAMSQELKRSRSRFYQPRTELAEPALAQFFYDLYRLLGPAQSLLSQKETSGGMRFILIERFLTPEQRKIKEGFTEEAIRARMKGPAAHEVLQQVQGELKAFIGLFESSVVQKINAEYRTLAVLLGLVHFDYYFLLRKFDSALTEGGFGYEPRFEPIHIQYVLEELEKFQDLLQVFEPQANWEKILDILREYRGVELVSREGFRRVLRLLTELRKSRVLEMVIRLALNDPLYRFHGRVFKERIVEEYLSSLKLQTEGVLQKIAQENRRSQVEGLKRQVFGPTAVVRLQNYTEKTNELYARRMLGGYSHTLALNYLRAFLVDSVRTDFRALVELLAIHAHWKNVEASQAFSEAFHRLMEINEEIGRLDESLGSDQEPGSTMGNLLARSDRDRRALPLLRQHLKEVNESARLLVERAGPHLINFGRMLKQLIEDLARPQSGLLILNWKEVQLQTDEDLRVRLVKLYKLLYAFVQLLQEAKK